MAIEYYFDYNCVQSTYNTVDHYLYDPITDISVSECGHTVYKRGYYSKLPFLLSHNKTISNLQSTMYRIVSNFRSIFNDPDNFSANYGWVDYKDGQGRIDNGVLIRYSCCGYSFSFGAFIDILKRAFQYNGFSPAVYNGDMNCLYCINDSLSQAYSRARSIASIVAKKKEEELKKQKFCCFLDCWSGAIE